MVYMSSSSPTRRRRQQLAGASVTAQRSALVGRGWREGLAGAGGCAGALAAAAGGVGRGLGAASSWARVWMSTANTCLHGVLPRCW